MTRRIRTYHETEAAGAELVGQVEAQAERLHQRLAHVRNVVVVASGKGGVGKSFVVAQITAGLAARGMRVGALDADINGPSLAMMLGVSRGPIRVDAEGVQPAIGRNGCRVMSSDLLLADSQTPVRWNEPAIGGFVWQSALETGTLREFVSDVAWGDLDVLILDLPPGTDKIARVLALLPRVHLLLLVRTPSHVSRAVVDRSITQVRESGVRFGVITNMAHVVCSSCGQPINLGSRDDASSDWAEIPFDPHAAAATDHGAAISADSPINVAIDQLIDRVQHELMPSHAYAR